MFSLKRLSIIQTFNLMLVVIVILPVLLTAIFLSHYEKREIAEENRAFQEDTMHVLASVMRQPLYNFTPEIEIPLLDYLALEKRIASIQVYDFEKQPFLSREWEHSGVGAQNTVRRDVIYTERAIGFIEVVFNNPSFGELFGNLRTIIIVLMVQLAFSALIFVYFFRVKIINPISTLEAHAIKLSQNDLDTPIAITGKDELGKLAAAFEYMRSTLKKHIDHLDEMVDEKTKQLRIIDDFQTQFIVQTDPFDMYERLRDDLLILTESTLGFIGETRRRDDGGLYLKVYALSNIAWDEATKELYESYRKSGFEFSKLDNLFGYAVMNEEVVLSNDPANDPRASGLPAGHPSIDSFLGIPVFYGERLVGEIGLANRPGGYDRKTVELLKPLAKTCGQIIVARQEKEAREKAELQLKEQAQHDGLTALYNRRYFNEQIATEWRRCAREEQELSVIMIDIDYFKAYNDTYGHLMGDSCLKAVADTLQGCMRRPSDMVARYGGEEFIAMLPNTSLKGAVSIAECINDQLAAKGIEHASSAVSSLITVSIGIATDIPANDSDATRLINEADKRLYEAKESGRNRIVSDENR